MDRYEGTDQEPRPQGRDGGQDALAEDAHYGGSSDRETARTAPRGRRVPTLGKSPGVESGTETDSGARGGHLQALPSRSSSSINRDRPAAPPLGPDPDPLLLPASGLSFPSVSSFPAGGAAGPQPDRASASPLSGTPPVVGSVGAGDASGLPSRPPFVFVSQVCSHALFQQLQASPELAGVRALPSKLQKAALRLVVHLGRGDGLPDSGFEGFQLCHEGVVAGCFGLGPDYGKVLNRVGVGVNAFVDMVRDALPAGALSVARAAWRSDATASRCTALSLRLSDSFHAAFEQDAEDLRESLRLYDFTLGRPVTLSERQTRALKTAAWEAIVRRREVEAELRPLGGVPPAVGELLDLLNSRPVQPYRARAREAYPAVNEMILDPDDPFRLLEDPVKRAALLDHNVAIRMVSRPHYVPGLRTQRLSPVGLSLANAPRAWRRVYLSDCFEIDMDAAQLALVASVWGVPSLLDWLDEGGSVWERLGAHLAEAFPGSPYDPEDDDQRAALKAVCKAFVYALVFGRSKKNLVRFGDPETMAPSERRDRQEEIDFLERSFAISDYRDVGRALLDHHVLSDVLAARRQRVERIYKEGGVTDLYGKRLRLRSTLGVDDDGRPREIDARTCLAAEIQACEVFVMVDHVARVFLDEEDRRAAAKAVGGTYQPRLSLFLWQHDGFSFRIKKQGQRGWESEATLQLDRLQDALREGCEALSERLGCPRIRTRLSLAYWPEGFPADDWA